jgi:hypothetical protein
MTNLGDPNGGNKHEQILTDIEVLGGWRGDRHGVDFRRHAAVELADAGLVWLACHHLLAGIRRSDLEQDLVRRVPRSTWPSHLLAPSHDGTLGSYDACRA